jgi:uncharacterized FAD-dependent dehydrogenase
MIVLRNVVISPDADFSDLRPLCAKALKTDEQNVLSCRLLRRSVDARRKSDIHFNCTFLVDIKCNEEKLLRSVKNAERYSEKKPECIKPKRDRGRPRPVVVGCGPAGLFAALTLARSGYCPILIERGRSVDQRITDVQRFWRLGELEPQSNVQFGEGGAGTFSDGKLNTGTKDTRKQSIFEDFVAASAPEEILYDAEPHIGTDRLIQVVKNLRKTIISLGGEVLFEHQLVDIKLRDGRICSAVCDTPSGRIQIDCDTLSLAIGHSARDTFEMLYDLGVPMIAKPFAVGARIEHLQSEINRAQYGDFARLPSLGAANYRLSAHLPNCRGVYTFCMCPGGQVVAASSEPYSVVTNGMSNYARDGVNANSAVLVGVNPEDFGSDHVLAGMEFQRRIERSAYSATGGYAAPAQRVGDFLAGRKTTAFGDVIPGFTRGVEPGTIDCCLPKFVTDSMRQGILLFDRKIEGFAAYDAVLTAPETRSSSPVRILRADNLQSPVGGIYPCGEGAGYAGGIVSAAVDGVRCAEAVIEDR